MIGYVFAGCSISFQMPTFLLLRRHSGNVLFGLRTQQRPRSLVWAHNNQSFPKMKLLRKQLLPVLILATFAVNGNLAFSQWKSIENEEYPVDFLCTLYQSSRTNDTNALFPNYEYLLRSSSGLLHHIGQFAFLECDSNLLIFSNVRDHFASKVESAFPDDIAISNGVIYHDTWFICTNHGIMSSEDKGHNWKYVNCGIPIRSHRSIREEVHPDGSVTLWHPLVDHMISLYEIGVFHDKLIIYTREGLFYLHKNCWKEFDANISSDYFSIRVISNKMLVFVRDMLHGEFKYSEQEEQSEKYELIVFYEGKKIKCNLPKKPVEGISYFPYDDKLFCSYIDGSLFALINKGAAWEECGQGLPVSRLRNDNGYGSYFVCANRLFRSYANGGLFVFINKEKTWKDCRQGLPTDRPLKVKSLFLYNNDIILTTADKRIYRRDYREIP